MAKRKRLNFVSTSNNPSEHQSNANQEHGQNQNEPTTTETSLGNSSRGYHSAQSSEAPSSQPSTAVDETSSESVVAKKGRGPTRKHEIWLLEPGKKVAVTFNEIGQPIGNEGKALADFLGTLVRMPNHVGINFADWRGINDATKESLWEIVKEKFVFLPAETLGIKKWVIEDMSTKLKSWKNLIKYRYYDPALTVDEMLAKVDDERINKDQLKELISMWLKPEYQEMCEKKKVCRLKNKEPHVTGSKSFARLTEEERIKNNGVRPTRGQIFIKTRTKKDGSIVNESAAAVVDAIKNVTESESDGTQARENDDWKNDDLSKVKGPEKRGRIRCLGKTVTLAERRATSSQDTELQIQTLQAQVSRLTTNFNLFVSAAKQSMNPDQFATLLSNLNNEVNDEHSPSNHRSSNGSHQTAGSGS